MRRRVGSFMRLLVLACALVTTLTAAPQGPAGTSDNNATTGPALSSLPPEVRLRKLHLVRPDLIPYPIAYEVVC